ncbi:MAG: hypothetical protein QOC76_4636 [Mycobacterium sp.]|nr:hypothetical protein [Mycobacterium sp.]
MVTMKMRAAIVVTGMIAAAFGATAPAGADPTDDPCQLAVTFLCRFVPMAPDLDHNVDLTKEPAIVDGQPLPEIPAGTQSQDTSPADICVDGCA